jgi:hypothetical protein
MESGFESVRKRWKPSFIAFRDAARFKCRAWISE